MSTAANERVPALTLGWRLKMALANSDLSREELARELGKTPSTLSRWMGDQGTPPARAYIMQWALLTGVSKSWLEHGVVVANPDPGDEGTSEEVAKTPDAVAELARRKRSRSGTTHTHRYLAPSVAA